MKTKFDWRFRGLDKWGVLFWFHRERDKIPGLEVLQIWIPFFIFGWGFRRNGRWSYKKHGMNRIKTYNGGCPVCPHCKEMTNPTYAHVKKLECWNCGRLIWGSHILKTIPFREWMKMPKRQRERLRDGWQVHYTFDVDSLTLKDIEVMRGSINAGPFIDTRTLADS